MIELATSKKSEAPVKATGAVPTYQKGHILTFKKYAKRRDLLKALLEDDREYTMEQVDSLLENWLKPKKGKVK